MTTSSFCFYFNLKIKKANVNIQEAINPATGKYIGDQQ
jgi:hypothetical protein